jgi:hypothetical protein
MLALHVKEWFKTVPVTTTQGPKLFISQDKLIQQCKVRKTAATRTAAHILLQYYAETLHHKKSKQVTQLF